MDFLTDPARRRDYARLAQAESHYLQLQDARSRTTDQKRIAGYDTQMAGLKAKIEELQEAVTPPSIEEMAQQAVEQEAEQIRLQNRIEELRAAHPDIPTPEDE